MINVQIYNCGVPKYLHFTPSCLCTLVLTVIYFTGGTSIWLLYADVSIDTCMVDGMSSWFKIFPPLPECYLVKLVHMSAFPNLLSPIYMLPILSRPLNNVGTLFLSAVKYKLCTVIAVISLMYGRI